MLRNLEFSFKEKSVEVLFKTSETEKNTKNYLAAAIVRLTAEEAIHPAQPLP